MSLTTRLAKLERQDGGECPVCGGARTTFHLILDPSAPREAPIPCPRCGRLPPAPFTIAIDRPDEGGE